MNPATGEHRSLRWCPTTEQVAVLEGLFSGGLRNPSTSQIHKIVDRLSHYGKVEGRNVFYWFQNHKAREKQKMRQHILRQHQQQPASYYNRNTFGGYTVNMVPEAGCLLSQQADGTHVASPCIPCHGDPCMNYFFHQGVTRAMCACCEPVSTMDTTTLEMTNPTTEPTQNHHLSLPTLDLFPATTRWK